MLGLCLAATTCQSLDMFFGFAACSVQSQIHLRYFLPILSGRDKRSHSVLLHASRYKCECSMYGERMCNDACECMYSYMYVCIHCVCVFACECVFMLF